MAFLLLPFLAIAYFVLYVLARSVPGGQQIGQQPLLHELHQEATKLGPQLSLSAWIAWEENIALEKLLDNVAPGGTNTHQAAPGTVIASPQANNPDYYFQCKTRLNLCRLVLKL
jgi:glucoamylase